MAFVNLGRFEFHGHRYSRVEPKYSNWVLLNRSWDPFLAWLGERWWGPVSEEYIASFMSRPEVPPRTAVVAQCFSNEGGGACSVVMKSQKCTLLTVDIHFTVGEWVVKFNFETECEVEPSKNLITLVQRVVLNFFHSALLARPADAPHAGPNSVSLTAAVDDMREMIVSLGGAWWGLWENLSYTRLIKKLLHRYSRERKRAQPHEPAFAMAFTDLTHNSICSGYLFTILACDKFNPVQWDNRSFTYNGRRFTTLRALFDYVRTVQNAEFGKGFFPTLQERCRTVVRRSGLWEHETIPPLIREYISRNDCYAESEWESDSQNDSDSESDSN